MDETGKLFMRHLVQWRSRFTYKESCKIIGRTRRKTKIGPGLISISAVIRWGVLLNGGKEHPDIYKKNPSSPSPLKHTTPQDARVSSSRDTSQWIILSLSDISPGNSTSLIRCL